MTVSIVLLSLSATVAVATDDDRGDRHHHVISAPELDPAQGMAALALLGGTIAILRGRRGKK